MPLFEYRCNNCDTKFDVLHKSSVNQEEVICPSCLSKDSKKLLSTFSAAVGSNSLTAGDSCSTGSCGVDYSGGCTSGFCGLN